MEFSRPEYWSGQPFPSPGDLPNPGIEPRSPALQVDSLPAGPQGKPKDTGVGSLSLLQEIFPTQGSNWGLLHCRQILYQLSYQGSPASISSDGNAPRVGHLSPTAHLPWMTLQCPRSDGSWDLCLNQEVETFCSREAPPACFPGDRPQVPGAPSPKSRPLRLCPLSGAEAHPGLESSLRVPPADMVLVLPCRVFFLNVPLDSVIERLTLRRTDPVTGERSVPAPQRATL